MNETYDNLIDNIKKAEAEIFLWQGLVDKINGIFEIIKIFILIIKTFNLELSKIFFN